MKRSTIVLLATFIILFIIAIFFLLPSDERITSYSLSDLNLKIDSASINKIEIKKNNKIITLENIGGIWNLTSPIKYLAAETEVSSLLSAANKFKITSLISSNPANQMIYQVDTLLGTHLTFEDKKGKKVLFILGKMGPSYLESYVRPLNSNNVYLAEGINSWQVNKDVREWRDKTIFKTEKDSIKQLFFEYSKNKFLLTKVDSINWNLDNKIANNANINVLLSTISNFMAEDFVDIEESLSAPQLNLHVTSTKTVNIQFYPILPDSTRYWVRTSQSPQIFIINKYQANQILKQKNDLIN